MRLTKAVADAAKYPKGGEGRRVVQWDDAVPGFGLRVYPGGRKSFVLSYRHRTRKRLLTIGPFGALTVQQARVRARKMLVLVTDGIDPAEAKRLRGEQAKTLRVLADEYMGKVKKTCKPSTARGYQQLLDAHILPEFGKLPPGVITEDDVQRFHRRMEDTPYAANRAMFVLSKLLTEAERRGLRPPGSNPCQHVKRYKETALKRHLSSAELARLGKALVDLEAKGKVSPHAAAALRLLLFTGCRLNEILRLRWMDIDFENAVVRVAESKTGERYFPLTPPVREVIDNLPRTLDNPWLIEGQHKGAHLTELRLPWERVCKAAKLADVRIHDMRHTVGSHAASSGLSLLLVGALLGHKQAASTERYAHLSDSPVREAAERVSGAIQAAMEDREAKVVDIK